jgi:siroheme synthase-like protein
MLPLMANVKGLLAVVVGGGPVGRRKAATVLDAGARVRLVCLEPRPPDLQAVEWLSVPYTAAHLDGAILAFAAAPPAVNQQVAADARARGILVNRADDANESDFHLPATLRRGQFLLAVGTGGAAPQLAQSIRDRLATEYDEAFGDWVAVLAELRSVVRARVHNEPERNALLARWCDRAWLELLRTEGPTALRDAMLAELDALARLPP